MQNKIEGSTDTADKMGSEKSLAAEQFADTAHKKVDQLADAGARAEKKVRSATTQASHKVDELSAEAVDTANEAMATAKQSIEKNPLVAAGAAFAVGFLLSSLLRR